MGRGLGLVLLAVAVAAVALRAPGAAAADAALPPLINQRPGNVHALLLTDCAKYQDWQAIAAAFAWRESGQPGAFTRVANCADKDRAAYPKTMLDYVDTHMAPHAAYNAELKDWYAAYNKPIAVKDWLEKNPQPKEEWVLLLDADMLLRHPFQPEEFNLTRGWIAAGHYDYMKGVANNLALRHIPEVTPYNDSIAGPPGRRGDVVGAPYFMHMDDARTLAPLWYDYTVRVRNDTQAWEDSGDTAAHKQERIWIAEMYGYAFGAAKAGLRHRWGEDFMLYPGYTPPSPPKNVHYGLLYHVDDWSFDKHWFFAFDVHKCPPWNLEIKRPQEGIFPPPPHPDKLKSKDYLQEYRDLLAVHTMAQINAAICDFHRRNCPPSQQLTDVCGNATSLYEEVKGRLKKIEDVWGCVDHNNECEMWAKRGECSKSERYMREHCEPACKFCEAKGEPYINPPERAKRAKAAAAAASPAAAAGGDGVAAAADKQQQEKQQEQEQKQQKDKPQPQPQQQEKSGGATVGDILAGAAGSPRPEPSGEDVAKILEREVGDKQGGGGGDRGGAAAAAAGEDGSGDEGAEQQDGGVEGVAAAVEGGKAAEASAGSGATAAAAVAQDRFKELVARCALLQDVPQLQACLKAAAAGQEFSPTAGAATAALAAARAQATALAAARGTARPLIEPIAPEDGGESTDASVADAAAAVANATAHHQKRLADLHAGFHLPGGGAGGRFESLLANGAHPGPKLLRAELLVLASGVAAVCAFALWRRSGSRGVAHWLPLLPRSEKDKHLSE